MIDKDAMIRMAREAGVAVSPPSWGYTESHHFAGFEQQFERFVALIDAASASVEREACAKVCEKFVMGSPYAAAIRARG